MSIVVFGTVFVDIKGYPFGTYIPAGRNAGRIEQVHGGVGRNVAEDVANLELRPMFVSVVDPDDMGEAVVRKLENHKVDTRFIRRVENGCGTWLAVFDHEGDVAASISKRPDLSGVAEIVKEHEEEIFADADSILLEIDMDKNAVREIFRCAQKYQKDVYALVSNISIALERRDLIRKAKCFVCNQQEAGIMFSCDLSDYTPQALADFLSERILQAGIPSMIVTMGEQGAVFADQTGEKGICPAQKVQVKDTTGAGDAFFAGAAAGLTYGKSMLEASRIGTSLAASVINTSENVCPRFRPEEFGLKAKD